MRNGVACSAHIFTKLKFANDLLDQFSNFNAHQNNRLYGISQLCYDFTHFSLQDIIEKFIYLIKFKHYQTSCQWDSIINFSGYTACSYSTLCICSGRLTITLLHCWIHMLYHVRSIKICCVNALLAWPTKVVYKITIGATFHPRQDVIKLTVSKHV